MRDINIVRKVNDSIAAVQAAGRRIADWTRSAIKDGRADLKKREVVVGEIARWCPRQMTAARRHRQWFKAPALRAAKAAAKEADAPWLVTIDRTRIENQSLQFEDRSRRPRTDRRNRLPCWPRNVSTKPESEGSWRSGCVNKKGEPAVARHGQTDAAAG